MAEISFVRSNMLPPQAPPITERGAVKWIRENLFPSPLNSALTLLGLVAAVWLFWGVLSYMVRGVWNASSLGECREIIWANFGEGAIGPCWAMVRERWHQFMFGFYPQEEFWRPILAGGFIMISLAPALYYGIRRSSLMLVGGSSLVTAVFLALVSSDATTMIELFLVLAALSAVAWFRPKMLLFFSLVAPVIAFWLIWGGSVWGPVGVTLGFGILALVFLLARPALGVPLGAGVGLLVASIWWLGLQSYLTTPLANAIPIQLEVVTSDQIGGFLLAFIIGVASIGASLPIGILLALGRQSDMILIKSLCVGMIEFVRGVPLITVLFTATLLLGYFLPPGSNFDTILRVIILVSLFSAAYMAEVIRGGLASLPKGQYEAADALGLDYWQAQRLIIMPQALKVSIPGIVGTFIGLFKDTTLVSFVALLDPLRGVTNVVRADIEWKGIYWEPYLFVGAIFFAACFAMSRYSMYLEQKLKTDHR